MISKFIDTQSNLLSSRYWRFIGRQLRRPPVLVLVGMLILAIIGPWFAPYDPLEPQPMNTLAAPSWDHWFGTDDYGFDVFSRVIHATRIDFSLALLGVLIGGGIGSLLGAIPGCGATIVVSSLYKNNKISFGGLFATFISTLGEGSFVLLGASNEADVVGNLKAYAIITIFGLISGIIFGYLVDISGFRTNSKDTQKNHAKDQSIQIKQNTLTGIFIENLGFYTIMAMAIFLAPGSIMALWGGSIEVISNLTYWVSVTLTMTCIIFYFVNYSCLNFLFSF